MYIISIINLILNKVFFNLYMIKVLSQYKYIKYDDIKIGKLLDSGNVSVYRGKYFNMDVAIKEYEYNEDNIEDHILNELKISSSIKSKRMMEIYTIRGMCMYQAPPDFSFFNFKE